MSEENNTTPELGLINIGGGAFCRVKKVTVVCDITDADGNMLERDGFTQSPGKQNTRNGNLPRATCRCIH